MKFYIALWFGKIIATVINIIDKKRGSNFSGKKAMAIDPHMISKFKGIDYSKVLFITGTNGKSTTNNLVNHIFRDNGKKVVSNLEGANLLTGIATSLIKASTLTGKINTDYIIFEVDERSMPLIYDELPAKNILITNLQKDQINRNGDPDFIYRKIWNTFKDEKVNFFLNNDDPRSKSFDSISSKVITYGVEKNEESFIKNGSYVTMPCPKCHEKINFDYYNTDGVGKFRCSSCGYSSEDVPNYYITNVDFENKTFKYNDIDFNMSYNTPYMLYNYAGAIAVAKEFGDIEPIDSSKSCSSFKNIGGRYEILKYKDKTIKYMRIKQENPDTLQTCLNLISLDPERKIVCFGLEVVHDDIPNYTSIAYTYDCDFSGLLKSNVEKFLCFTNVVCYDTANRLIYEGVDPEIIEVIETEEPKKIFEEIEKVKAKDVYLIVQLVTFEKMQRYINKE